MTIMDINFTNPRAKLAEAAHAIYTYRHPDVLAVHNMLYQIAQAAALGDCNPDNHKLIDLSIANNLVTFQAAWLSDPDRVEQFEFPIEIVDSDDILRSARRWGLEQAMNGVDFDMERLQDRITELRIRRARLEAELAEMAQADKVEALGLDPRLNYVIIVDGGQWARGSSEEHARQQFKELHSSRKIPKAQVWAVTGMTYIGEGGGFVQPKSSYCEPVRLDKN